MVEKTQKICGDIAFLQKESKLKYEKHPTAYWPMAKYSALSTGGGESHIEFKSLNAKKNMQLVAKAREGCVESIHLECNRECNRQWILSAYSIHIFTTGLKNM